MSVEDQKNAEDHHHFLVRHILENGSDDEVELIATLRSEEGLQAARLHEAGKLLSLWRVPGEAKAWGIWRVATREELQELLAAMPLYKWSTFEIRPLEPHPALA